MLIFAIDTSSEWCSIAVSDDSRCRVEYTFRHERRLIERLPGIVQFVLNDAGIALTDIDLFAVGRGPGSFTGVRVGVTMAKVWAMTLEKPVIGVSSLDALVEPLAVNNIPIVAVAPTRRTESVAAFYLASAKAPVHGPLVIANTEIIVTADQELFGSADSYATILLVGEIASTIWEAPPERQQGRVRQLSAVPTASAIARLAFSRWLEGDIDDTDSLVPLYVTPPPTG